jgi:hypothetical protein
MAEDVAAKAGAVAVIRPDSRSYPIGRTPRGYAIWCLWGEGCPVCAAGKRRMTMAGSYFSPGDKVIAQYGALLDDDGEPMTATVLPKGPNLGDDWVLIRYRCTDGSATDNWVRAGNLMRADVPGA